MKKTLKALLTGMAFIALTLASCMDPNFMANGTAGIDDNDDDTTLKDNDGKSDKDIVLGAGAMNFGDDFIRGFDASAVDYDEERNGFSSTDWKDLDGKSKDFFKVLAAYGVNTVRLRLWVDPDKALVSGDDYWPSTGTKDLQKAGDNTLERYMRMAERAKNAGLKVMLDLHYSDYWTDPGCQLIPCAWQDISTATAMAQKINEYTTDVLKQLADKNLLPDYVQVGNEIDSGILLHSKVSVNNGSKTVTSAPSDIAGTGDNLVAYLKAGCDAVRSNAPDAKIILHVTNRTNGIKRMDEIVNNDVDFDIVGLSFYPWESGHRTTTDLVDSINKFKNKYDVMVVETSAHWKGRAADDGLTDDSSTKSELTYIKDHMLDNSKSPVTTYGNLALTDDGAYVLATLDNSKRVIEDIMQTVKDAGGVGICTWGGERREDWKYGMFNYSDKQALSNITAFMYQFDGDNTEVDYAITKLVNDTASAEITIRSTNVYQPAVSYDAIKDYKAVYITFANITTWGGDDYVNLGTNSAWVGDTTWQYNGSFSDSNVGGDSGGYFAQISPSDYKDGVWVTGVAGLAGTLYVTGIKDDSGTGGGTDGGDVADPEVYTMTVTLTFEDSIGATSVKVTAYDGETLSDSSITAAVSNNKAILLIPNTYVNEWSWINIKFEITGSNTDNIALTSDYSGFGGTCEKCWFEFKKDETLSIVVNRDTGIYTPLVENKTITVEKQTYTQVLGSSAFSGITLGTLKVTISSETASAWVSLSSKAEWTEDTYIADGINNTILITQKENAAFMEKLYDNGLYIESSAGTFSVSVSYSGTSGN